MLPTSYIEISKSALAHNISFIKNMLGPDVIFSSVVKGNAYGHNISAFVPLVYEQGIRHFSVFSASEAYEVKEALSSEPSGQPTNYTIMIMGMIENNQLEWAIENGIEFYVFDKERLHAAIACAKKLNVKCNVHIEVETGMNRTGFALHDLENVWQLIEKNNEYVNVAGICTHLAGAESIANYKRIKDQQKLFNKVKKNVADKAFLHPKFHAACSAAAIRYPKSRQDLARIGIMHYGFFPNNETYIHYLTKNNFEENPLKRVISWKTKVMDIKEVKTGEFVGYGTAYFTNQKTKIALIPVGYAHGFARSLSNKGKVLLRGKRINVIGVVNMNMITVDLTDVPYAERGDEVVLIGTQGEQEISVSSFSNIGDFVNYELLTRLPNDIPRIIKN